MAKPLINLPTVDNWLETDNLILLECWARDGYTVDDIAFKIGISTTTLLRWMRNEKEIKKAINNGRELVDYKVENALLKAALGYKTKEVKITTTIRFGKVVEEVKETTTSEAAPNVQACKVWLYNRQPKKWKPESVRGQSLLDSIDNDNDIKITIERAGSREQELAEAGSGHNIRTGIQTDDIDEEWQDEVNNSVSIRKATEQERKEAIKEKQKARKKSDTEIIKDDNEVSGGVKRNHSKSNTNYMDDISNIDDVDYWPDDWIDDE